MDVTTSYNEKYQNASYFRYSAWLYRPFIKALIGKAQLKVGSQIIDVGCGQGFFTSLFREQGLDAVGVDISDKGVQSAINQYAHTGATFEVGDILSLDRKSKYDCVFVRGLSLYNSHDFRRSRSTTDALLTYLKPGGVLIFDYHSNFCPKKKSKSWIFHTVSDVKEHFSAYPNADAYFSLRLESLLLGRCSFSAAFTRIAALISRITGLGGELVVIVRRTVQ